MTDSVPGQLEFTEAELLADHDIAEPLIADGVRCHGGFDEDGTYVSPRTKHRGPAIEAWQAQQLASSSARRCSTSRSTRWPENFPNVEQSQLPHRRTA